MHTHTHLNDYIIIYEVAAVAAATYMYVCLAALAKPAFD